MPLLRIPYTDPLPAPTVIPKSARTIAGAVAALSNFLSSPPQPLPVPHGISISNGIAELASASAVKSRTVLLTGAGISVASGLADYRGTKGTYTLNRTYRPVYYGEFVDSHESRKRYWARSFIGWANMTKAKPNRAHSAIRRLGELGFINNVITQNVDSLHPRCHPHLSTIELHGYLRSLVCVSCRREYPRTAFQTQLAALNPAWSAFLQEMIATGALDTENPAERWKRGYKANPDGDIDIPNAPYTTFRYPACQECLSAPPDGVKIDVDSDGAWLPSSNGGVLKPAVIMFGESIPTATKIAAEEAVNTADRMLIVGSSLATYSAWRLVKQAKLRGMPIAVLNIGGVRNEEQFFVDVPPENAGEYGVRSDLNIEDVLPAVVEELGGIGISAQHTTEEIASA